MKGSTPDAGASSEHCDRTERPGRRLKRRTGRSALFFALLWSCAASADAQYPRWWIDRGVVDSVAAVTNDFAVANQGQLKWIAAKAREELDANLRNGAGAEINDLIAGFSAEHDYAAVNQGQVKAVAAPFYERLIAEDCASGFPWTQPTEDDNDYAAANIGQVKRVFSFNLDADDNGLPDWWERENEDLSGGDADGDGWTGGQEGEAGTDPFDVDTDGDGVLDSADDSATSATDSDGDALPDDWERFWFGALDLSGPDDPDGDGRSNGMEFREGTDPTRADGADVTGRAEMNVFRPGE